MMETDLHNSQRRLEKEKENIAVFRNGKMAVSAGAKVEMPMMDAFWGDRCGSIVDPFGHKWMISTHKKDLSPEEMAKAGAEAMKSMNCG